MTQLPLVRRIPLPAPGEPAAWHEADLGCGCVVHVRIDSAGVVHPGRLERTHERHDLRAAFGGWVAGRGLRGAA